MTEPWKGHDMNIVEKHVWMGRELLVTWRDASFSPPQRPGDQASGICFTEDGTVVLVTNDGQTWSLPGGHTEPGESAEETLVREVNEEACAKVTDLAYLGSQEVRDLADSIGSTVHYQALFWARVRLSNFEPKYETTARKLVSPSEVNDVLRWKPSAILDAIMAAALACENRARREHHTEQAA
jgi:ADP-ribose pyrophosphatase YjhB (NUDIX family)